MKVFLAIFLAASIIANIILGTYISTTHRTTQKSKLQAKQEELKYLSQRVFIENPNDNIINFVPLREQLTTYTENNVKTPFGLYFEYLPTGVSIGIKEKDSYVLASLLKVPLAMAVYKQMEKGTIRHDQVFEVKEEQLDPYFGNLWKAGAGSKISTDEAIREILINSDNTAKNVLFSSIPDGSLENVFDSLDIPKELESNLPVVTPKNYSSILRSLYLSSYLRPEDSNEILFILTQTPFKDKLVAGVDPNIKVAHKIGVHEGNSQTKSVFTDCGIVYYPKRPYILCMMTRSTDQEAQKYMSNVSKIVFNYMKNLE